MNKLTKGVTVLGLLASICITVNAQTREYTVADAHSHNDYKQYLSKAKRLK
jgi:alkaline phosphatase